MVDDTSVGHQTQKDDVVIAAIAGMLVARQRAVVNEEKDGMSLVGLVHQVIYGPLSVVAGGVVEANDVEAPFLSRVLERGPVCPIVDARGSRALIG